MDSVSTQLETLSQSSFYDFFNAHDHNRADLTNAQSVAIAVGAICTVE
jgi:hypothetical protein